MHLLADESIRICFTRAGRFAPVNSRSICLSVCAWRTWNRKRLTGRDNYELSPCVDEGRKREGK